MTHILAQNSNAALSSGMDLTILGVRGTMPVSTAETMQYGGNTSCYLFQTDKEAIIIDAGTGIMNLPDTGNRHLTLLITHTHIDHILGLPMFLATHQASEITIYGKNRNKLTIQEQLDRYLTQPLWPVSIQDYQSCIHFAELSDEPFTIGDIAISTMPSNHPGGSTIFKLQNHDKTIVLATDFEHELPEALNMEIHPISPLESLAKFAENADILLYDAQYTPKEYERCRGYGHSTYEQAIRLKELSKATEILLIHHAPGHNDDFLDELQKNIDADGYTHIRFAKEGQIL